LGIIGAIFVLLYHFVIIEKKINKFILLSIIAFFVHLILYIILPYYTSSFNRSLNKIMDLDTDSAIRLTGQIHLYDNLPSINKLFGVGISQLSNFFSSKGIDIPNYSNAFVITLFNTGIIGLFIFIMFFLCLLFKWKKKVIYILICIMICAVDYFIYSFFFYYVLGFVFIESKSSKYSN
jgi:O-antigen ligase